jgi:4-hydroxy-3-methylbut-2-enyl diphosphate reductase
MSEELAVKGENFEELLKENDVKTLSNGDLVSGYITAVSDQDVSLAIDGTKYTGILKVSDTNTPEAKLTDLYKVGQTIDVSVYYVSEKDGFVYVNTKKVDALRDQEALKAAYEQKVVLEGKVEEVNDAGVIVKAFNQKVFIAKQNTFLPKDADLNTLLDKNVKFRIINVKGKRNNPVGSIKSVEVERLQKERKEFWDEIEIGKQYTGVVKSIINIGAFVNLGPVDGLLRKDQISWDKHPRIDKYLSVGQEITVFVRGYDKDKKQVDLGYKTDETNPWVIFTNTYKVDDIVEEAKIVSIMSYGAFASIIPGVDGLIHISQIINKRVDDINHELKKGQIVRAKIIKIDEEAHKVSLSMRALIEDVESDEEAEDAEEVVDEAVEETSEVAAEEPAVVETEETTEA